MSPLDLLEVYDTARRARGFPPAEVLRPYLALSWMNGQVAMVISPRTEKVIAFAILDRLDDPSEAVARLKATTPSTGAGDVAYVRWAWANPRNRGNSGATLREAIRGLDWPRMICWHDCKGGRAVLPTLDNNRFWCEILRQEAA